MIRSFGDYHAEREFTMIPSKRTPSHPGKILRFEYLDPLELTASDLATHLGVSEEHVCAPAQRRGGSRDPGTRVAPGDVDWHRPRTLDGPSVDLRPCPASAVPYPSEARRLIAAGTVAYSMRR